MSDVFETLHTGHAQLAPLVENLTDTPQQPDGELSLPAEAWLRSVTGRLRPEHTPAAVTLTGAISLDELRPVFPGF